MRKRTPIALATWAISILGSGCTTFLYKGPTRPSSEVAIITSHETIVEEVDDVKVREHASGSFAQLEVLPGPHRLGITLNRVTPGFFVTHVARSEEVVICFDLQAGHKYQTQPGGRGDRFFPSVVDLATGRIISPHCHIPQARPAAASAAPALAPRIAQPAPTANPAPPGALVPAGASEPATTPGPAADGTPADDQAVVMDDPLLSRPPPTRAQASDTEEPYAASVPAIGGAQNRVRLASDAELAMRKPGSGLSMFFGGAFGGADFVKASNSDGDESTLSSGSGVIAGIGATLTPLWAADTVGFGLGVDGAIKYDHLGASNGSASITRFPVALTAHILTDVSDGLHFLIFKGGVTRDFGVNYSASGFASIDADVSGTWGPIGAVGYYKRTNDVFGWDLLAFFTVTKHVIGAERISANSIGVTWGLHWQL